MHGINEVLKPIPSCIGNKMFEKSSFNKIISAASIATLDPEITKDILISTFFIAGESITTFPVIATTW